MQRLKHAALSTASCGCGCLQSSALRWTPPPGWRRPRRWWPSSMHECGCRAYGPQTKTDCAGRPKTCVLRPKATTTVVRLCPIYRVDHVTPGRAAHGYINAATPAVRQLLRLRPCRRKSFPASHLGGGRGDGCACFTVGESLTVSSRKQSEAF